MDKCYKNVERRIREAMREFDLHCTCCGSDALVIEKWKDTDVGIMDDIRCEDCDYKFTMVSSVHTYFVD